MRDQLGAFLDSRAWRREAKAAGLPEAAALVRGLPDDDPLLDWLEKLIQATGLGLFELVPGDEAASGVNAPAGHATIGQSHCTWRTRARPCPGRHSR